MTDKGENPDQCENLDEWLRFNADSIPEHIFTEIMWNRAESNTLSHMLDVSNNLGRVIAELTNRQELHDRSKLTYGEISNLADLEQFKVMNDVEPARPGSEAYARRMKMLGPMLKHHYAHNSHHPEHYKDGIDGMDLIDMIEMLCDWVAAAEARDNATPNFDVLQEKYDLSDQLCNIFENSLFLFQDEKDDEHDSV